MDERDGSLSILMNRHSLQVRAVRALGGRRVALPISSHISELEHITSFCGLRLSCARSSREKNNAAHTRTSKLPLASKKGNSCLRREPPEYRMQSHNGFPVSCAVGLISTLARLGNPVVVTWIPFGACAVGNILCLGVTCVVWAVYGIQWTSREREMEFFGRGGAHAIPPRGCR
ncbi:hypothetical protein DFH09DRAFT_176181 [Mycena vulgaris]|nr:hypothetical protein DFH09DRAFT_176181 [Mycena vulgaris]